MSTHNISNPIRAGLAAAWPICLGFLPLGLAFGVLARTEGLAPWQVALMSVVVFAGSAQFAGVAMLGAGAAAATIIAATFMINLRHLLMSTVLAGRLRGRGRWFRALYAYGITDESFALNLDRFLRGGWDPGSALAVNHVTNAAWIGSTVLGAYAGAFIPPGAFGIDFALPASFICLLAWQLRGREHLLAAVAAAGLALVLALAVPGQGTVILAATLGAAAGGLAKAWRRRVAR